jgi:hypothetical protein
VSGTKRMFELTQRIAELEQEGHTEIEIAKELGEEYNLESYLAESIVDSYYKNKIAKNFSYDGDISYGS